MKTRLACLLIAISPGALTTAQAQFQPAPRGSTVSPQRLMNEASSQTGTLIKKEMVWSSKIPLNRTYGELTPEQKAEFHAMYESLPTGDEPPFPLEGLKPIFSAIKKAQASVLARGELNLIVTVGPDGKARQVEDYGSVDNPEMTKFAASVLLMTKFKPAVCDGTPCTMQFPFNLKLKRG
jgi:hypothetical protein